MVDKLGFEGYSTVWLARDPHLKKYVAVKIRVADSLPRHQCAQGLVCTAAIVLACTPWAWSSSLSSGGIRGARSEWNTYVVHSGTAECNPRGIFSSRLFSLEVACTLSHGLAQDVAYVTAVDGFPFPFSCSPNAASCSPSRMENPTLHASGTNNP